ncbi:MAG: NAD(P)H-dependent glycerol-3-phosphate dehydrogenase [Phycisphaerales bacterium]
MPTPASSPRPSRGTTSVAPANHPTRVAILGLGQMGLVCAGILSEPPLSVPTARGSAAAKPPPATPRANVRLWGHSPDEAGALMQTRASPRLPGFTLAPHVRIAVKDSDALEGADLIVSAVPVQFSRQVWERLRRHVPPTCPIVSVAKGIENTTLLRPTQIIAQALGGDAGEPARALACLSGPTIAAELAKCLPATMVAASDDAALAKRIQGLFTTRWLRIYTHHDLVGVEIAGAIKNVIAIAAGVLDGLHAGNNAKSALLARGLAEIARLGAAMGASPDTFFGVTGVGDLATSCFSPEGRNRSLGEALGRGQTLEQALRASRHVVEGVATTRSVADLARKHKVEMPITAAVYAILFDGLDPIEAIGTLMTRSPKAERVG